MNVDKDEVCRDYINRLPLTLGHLTPEWTFFRSWGTRNTISRKISSCTMWRTLQNKVLHQLLNHLGQQVRELEPFEKKNPTGLPVGFLILSKSCQKSHRIFVNPVGFFILTWHWQDFFSRPNQRREKKSCQLKDRINNPVKGIDRINYPVNCHYGRKNPVS